MTDSHPADVQRPSTHSGPGTVRPSIPSNVPNRRPLPPSRSDSTVANLSSSTVEQNTNPAKRRKLDDKPSDNRNDPTPSSSAGPPRPSISFAAELAKLRPVLSDNSSVQSPPLPIRPWKHRSSNTDTAMPLHQARDYGKVQATPFRLEPPAQGPKYRDNRTADFNPWAGKHPEDTLSEQTVRNGYYDRPISQNETGTARPSLYSIFKHKSGLDTLSSLFLRAVEQKDSHGKIGTTSSFKPPPRVTLTEAKRKAWLNDLADSDVPLRKLSRTIPQGIRGQQLLEQCLANSVPIGRAVWFAKCVGANEIRTLKRKGTSGTFVAGAELKWLQEWTAGVEHFLGDIVSTCGSEHWRRDMAYALDVLGRFYAESMLDKDHFVRWLVTAVSNVDLDKLPIWLAVSRGFWADITRLRSHGRIFARALLRHLGDARSEDTDDFKDMIETLSEDIRTIARRRSLLLVLPDTWEDCKSILDVCLDDRQDYREILAEISSRNGTLKACRDDSALNTPSVRQMIIDILDSAKAPYDNGDIAQRCLDTCQNHYTLVRTVLEWSSTPFRVRRERRYLAVQLLRRWHAKGIDLERPVRDIVVEQGRTTAIDTDCLFKITGLLIRLRLISISRFLQMVIATGFEKTTPELLRLIQRAPTVNSPTHVRNLRRSVLSKAGYVQDEEAQVETCRACLAYRWPSLFSHSTRSIAADLNLSKRSEYVQAEIARWMLSHVEARDKNSGGTVSTAFAMTLDEFCGLRANLEEIEDLTTLAECLRRIARAEDDTVLTATTETIHAHLAEFSALEELSPLCSILGETYQKLRSSSTVSRTWTVSLLNLTRKVSVGALNATHLLEDLARGDRSVAIAACSPISDHTAENLQQAGASFVDEYDQLLSGGNIMDDRTMARLFWTLADRIEGSMDAPEAEKTGMCQMVVRLMTFRPRQFEQLLQTWFKRMARSTKSPSAVIELLIGSDVVSVRDVVVACRDLVIDHSPTQAPAEADIARHNLSDILRRHIDPEAAAKDPALYRLRYSRAACLADVSTDVQVPLLRIRDADLSNGDGQDDQNYWGVRYTVDCLVRHPSILSAHGTAIVANVLSLSSQHPQGLTSTTLTMLDSKDAFSLPLRRAYMKHVYDELADPQHSSPLSRSDLINHLFESARQQTGVDQEWACFVSAFGSTGAQHLRQRAEETFFTIPPPYNNARNGYDPSTIAPSQTLIDMIEKTAFTIPDSGAQSTAASIVDRLAGLFRHISSASQGQPAHEDVERPNFWTDELCVYFLHLLRLAALHRSSFTPSSTGQWQAQLQVRILLFLTSIAIHPSLAVMAPDATTSRPRSLVERSIDVLAVLSDDLPEESRLVLTKHLKDRMRDPRVRTLFGSLLTESSKNDEELVISREANAAAGKEALSAEYKIKSWEMIQGIHTGGGGASSGAGTGSGMNDTSISLSLFQGRVISGKNY